MGNFGNFSRFYNEIFYLHPLRTGRGSGGDPSDRLGAKTGSQKKIILATYSTLNFYEFTWVLEVSKIKNKEKGTTKTALGSPPDPPSPQRVKPIISQYRANYLSNTPHYKLSKVIYR